MKIARRKKKNSASIVQTQNVLTREKNSICCLFKHLNLCLRFQTELMQKANPCDLKMFQQSKHSLISRDYMNLLHKCTDVRDKRKRLEGNNINNLQTNKSGPVVIVKSPCWCIQEHCVNKQCCIKSNPKDNQTLP